MWNTFLAFDRERREAGKKLPGYTWRCRALTVVRGLPKYAWLAEGSVVAQQRPLRQLGEAWSRHVKDRAAVRPSDFKKIATRLVLTSWFAFARPNLLRIHFEKLSVWCVDPDSLAQAAWRDSVGDGRALERSCDLVEPESVMRVDFFDGTWLVGQSSESCCTVWRRCAGPKNRGRPPR